MKQGQDSEPCRISEILQYSCTLQTDRDGKPQVHCFPIPRIFKICRGKPAVEITKLVEVDLATGEVLIPPDASSEKLLAKTSWSDIIRYEMEDSSNQ